MGFFDFFSGDKDTPPPLGASPTLHLPIDPEPGELRFSKDLSSTSDGHPRISPELGLPIDASPLTGAPPLTFDPKLKEWPPRTSETLMLPVQPDEGAPELRSAEWKEWEKTPHVSDRKSAVLSLPADPEPGALIMSMPMRRRAVGSVAHFQPAVGPEGIEIEDLHLLISEQRDELVRSRTREAIWLSIIFHIVLIVTLKWAPKYLFREAVVLGSPADQLKNKKDLSYISLPPDLQKLKTPPKTDVISDKDRMAVSRNPKLDKLLQQLRDNRAIGVPAPTPQPNQAPTQPLAQAAPPQQQPPENTAKPESKSPIQFESPNTAPTTNAFRVGSGSASTNIEQAARASSMARNSGYGGDFGNGQGRSNSENQGMVDVLSDTMGVDFEPYLKRVVESVRMNWYNIIPEIARPPLSKRGMVSIEFLITKDGKVAGMKLHGPSGDTSLDRAAWGGITASSPFPALPVQFKGDYLALRFRFYYNPAPGDMR
jgi:TonB family protein